MDIENKSYEFIPSGENGFCGCEEQNGCTKTGYQCANVSVSIELTPDVKIGDMETKCCGQPDVFCKYNQCTNSYDIMLVQKVCVKIPIHYNTTASVSESTINCCKPCCK